MSPQGIGPGSVVAGRFHLEDLCDEELGAQVWHAQDRVLRRSVSLHTLPATDARAPRVLYAARGAAGLRSPSLLRVLDAFEEHGYVHVVHEWGTGASLARLITSGDLDATRIGPILAQVAGALAGPHALGLGHGYLTPDNIRVDGAGNVRLAYFGIDAALRGRAAEDAVPDDLADLPALLYAGLVAKWHGHGDSVLQAAPRQSGQPIRPRQVRAGVPRDLDDLWGALWGAVAAGRPTSAVEVEALLAGPEAWTPVSVPEPEPESTRALVGVPSPDSRTDSRPDARSGSASDDRDPDATQWSARVTDRLPPPASPAVPPPAPVPSWDGSDDPDEDPPGSLWLRLGILAAAILLLVMAVLVAGDLTGHRSGADPTPTPRGGPSGSGSGSGASATPGTPTPIVGVTDFDPAQVDGPPEENHSLVPLAVDGDPATAWRTLRYVDGPALAPYKPGVGLLLDLGREVDVSAVDVRLVGEGYTVQALTAPAAAPRPDSLAGLTTWASAQGGPSLQLHGAAPVRTRYVVVWLTALAAVPGGYQGQVAEVVVRS